MTDQNPHSNISWSKYLLVFGITASIFTIAIYTSNFFSNKKLSEIQNISDKIAIDILSSETQFSLLEESSSCKDLTGNALTDELSALADKLNYTEQNRGASDQKFLSVKRYYTLLEIKHYLLMKKIARKCGTDPIFVMYFYGNSTDCHDCEREGYVLTSLREKVPNVQVYAFDYDLDLSTTKTLITINKLEKKLPALIVNDKVYYGFNDISDLSKNVPQIKKGIEMAEASSTKALNSTTTKK